MAGSLCAINQKNINNSFFKKINSNLITIFGLMLIVISFILFRDNYRNPSLITILC